MYIYIYIYIYIYMYITDMNTCVYIHMYIYINIFTHASLLVVSLRETVPITLSKSCVLIWCMSYVQFV